MARSSDKATKSQISRPKTARSKARAGASTKAAKTAKAAKAAKSSVDNAHSAKTKKRAENTAKTKKPARATRAGSKPAAAKKAASKRPKAAKAAKAPKPAAAPKPRATKKAQAAAAQAASPAPAWPPPDRRRRAPKTVPPPPPPPVDKQAEQAAKALRQLELRQTENYEKAVEYFNARRFGRALPLMEKAVEGPNTTLRHRAHVYADICRQQIGDEKVELKTADDNYNYGVKLMNDRRLGEAERYLQRALRLAPKAGHVHYANAVLAALQGNVELAFGNLKRAIEIDPLNRVLALNDADLGSVVGHPPIAHLLHQGGGN